MDDAVLKQQDLRHSSCRGVQGASEPSAAGSRSLEAAEFEEEDENEDAAQAVSTEDTAGLQDQSRKQNRKALFK